MKSLFYKEMKLAMHPAIWFMVLFFPLMVLIPSYPIFIAYIYVCSAYPVLFLGANKGQQSNDIYFSCLLPVKKSDVIKARMMTVLFLQLITVVLCCALSPIGDMLKQSILNDPSTTAEQAAELIDVGFGFKGLFASTGFTIVGLAIYDVIYFLNFYRNGRAILSSTSIGMLVFIIYEVIFCVGLPLGIPAFKAFFENNIVISLITFLVGILLSALIHFLTFKKATELFEKVDL